MNNLRRSRETTEGERLPHCPGCGTPYATQEDDAGCPVYSVASGDAIRATIEGNLVDGHFDHYELVRCGDGTFEESGVTSLNVGGRIKISQRWSNWPN